MTAKPFDATRRTFLTSTGTMTAVAALGGLVANAAKAGQVPSPHGHLTGATDGLATVAASIVRDPADLPKPLPRRRPMTVRVDLTTIEVDGQLAHGTTYHYWTFNGKVPGPFVRVRVGDTSR